MWKYKSNDFNNISLHDNFIEIIQISNETIKLCFNDGFNIVKTHPLNNTGKSKHTGNAILKLESAKFSNGQVFSSENNNRMIDLNTVFKDLTHFEVLKFEWNKSISMFYLFGNLTNNQFHNDFCELTFICDNASFYWNDYIQDAWFENWP
ncbi:MAG: hypothetical protein ACK5LC_07775 [Coprobacillaceae bacterium]